MESAKIASEFTFLTGCGLDERGYDDQHDANAQLFGVKKENRNRIIKPIDKNNFTNGYKLNVSQIIG